MCDNLCYILFIEYLAYKLPNKIHFVRLFPFLCFFLYICICLNFFLLPPKIEASEGPEPRELFLALWEKSSFNRFVAYDIGILHSEHILYSMYPQNF